MSGAAFRTMVSIDLDLAHCQVYVRVDDKNVSSSSTRRTVNTHGFTSADFGLGYSADRRLAKRRRDVAGTYYGVVADVNSEAGQSLRYNEMNSVYCHRLIDWLSTSTTSN